MTLIILFYLQIANEFLKCAHDGVGNWILQVKVLRNLNKAD